MRLFGFRILLWRRAPNSSLNWRLPRQYLYKCIYCGFSHCCFRNHWLFCPNHKSNVPKFRNCSKKVLWGLCKRTNLCKGCNDAAGVGVCLFLVSGAEYIIWISLSPIHFWEEGRLFRIFAIPRIWMNEHFLEYSLLSWVFSISCFTA